MDPVLCGCDVVRESEKEVHQGNREQKADAGRELQRQLNCPVPRNEPFPDDRSGLDALAARSLDAVERLTGACGLTTCPKAYACRPGVNAAMVYRNRRDLGWLAQTAPQELPAKLVRQIEMIDYAKAQRDLAEQRAREAANKPKVTL